MFTYKNKKNVKLKIYLMVDYETLHDDIFKVRQMKQKLA